MATSPSIAPVHPLSDIFSGTLPAAVQREPVLLTVRQVAGELRVCTATIYRLIASGKLKALRIGGSFIRVHARDLAQITHPARSK